jgi:hypothetical protein
LRYWQRNLPPMIRICRECERRAVDSAEYWSSFSPFEHIFHKDYTQPQIARIARMGEGASLECSEAGIG